MLPTHIQRPGFLSHSVPLNVEWKVLFFGDLQSNRGYLPVCLLLRYFNLDKDLCFVLTVVWKHNVFT